MPDLLPTPSGGKTRMKRALSRRLYDPNNPYGNPGERRIVSIPGVPAPLTPMQKAIRDSNYAGLSLTDTPSPIKRAQIRKEGEEQQQAMDITKIAELEQQKYNLEKEVQKRAEDDAFKAITAEMIEDGTADKILDTYTLDQVVDEYRRVQGYDEPAHNLEPGDWANKKIGKKTPENAAEWNVAYQKRAQQISEWMKGEEIKRKTYRAFKEHRAQTQREEKAAGKAASQTSALKREFNDFKQQMPEYQGNMLDYYKLKGKKDIRERAVAMAQKDMRLFWSGDKARSLEQLTDEYMQALQSKESSGAANPSKEKQTFKYTATAKDGSGNQMGSNDGKNWTPIKK